MDVIDITPPAIEPVSLARAKLFLRVEHDAEDELIADMISAARQRVESYLGASLIERERRIKTVICGDTLTIKHRPIKSINAIHLIMNDGSAEIVSTDQYQVNLRMQPARVLMNSEAVSLTSRKDVSHAEIDITAGYGASEADIPTPLTQAILLLLAQSYERGEPLGRDIPMMVQALLMPYRGLRL